MSNDIIKTQSNIRFLQKELNQMRKEITQKAEKKAEAIAKYRKQVSIELLKISSSGMAEIDGVSAKVTATNAQAIAKGICWKEKMESASAEGAYKALLANMEAVKAILNAEQSINRYVD